MLFETDADFDKWAQEYTMVNVKMYTLLSVGFFRDFPALVPMIVSEHGDDGKHFTLAVGVGTCETCRLLMCTNYPYGSLRCKLDFRAAVEPATVVLTH